LLRFYPQLQGREGELAVVKGVLGDQYSLIGCEGLMGMPAFRASDEAVLGKVTDAITKVFPDLKGTFVPATKQYTSNVVGKAWDVVTELHYVTMH
jgi:hypothetical protein